MVKEDTVYSTPWKAVKATANITVKIVPYKAHFLLPCITEWWAYVTVKPEDNSKILLSRGNSKALIDSIPLGGHCAPISIGGDNELWKKVQNIQRKNSASLTINKPTPIFNPLCTAKVWLPK